MPLPIVGFGFQADDGNIGEHDFVNTGDPATITTVTAVNLTVAQILSGLIITSPGATATSYTVPTGALIDAAFNAPAKVGITFDFFVVNLGTTTGVATIVGNAGVTLSGWPIHPVAAAGSSGRWRLRKTALPSSWQLIRAT